MSSLIKKNMGSCFHADKWTEYPKFGKKWRSNWDATFGVKETESEPQPAPPSPPPSATKPAKQLELRPGSQEAVDAGCTCPVLDNHYGMGFPYGGTENCYYINEDCPLHASSDEQ